MRHREMLDHMESDGSVSIQRMRVKANELASALDAADDAKRDLRNLIAEWRKGCSCASAGKPEECPACTVALIEAIEARLA